MGTVIFSAVGLLLGVTGGVRGWPLGWIVAMVVVAVAGLVLTLPVRSAQRSDAQGPGTAFIRGSADGATLVDIDSDAQTFVDGSAREALLWRIVHRRGNS